MPRRRPPATVPRRPRAHPGLRAALPLLLGIAVLAPGLSPAASAADWRLPVDGEVVGGFRVTPAAPFAEGQRRGIDLLARPGATVRAVCAGVVRFAGRVPGRGRVVTVRCARGPWVATHGGLAATRVPRGRVVRRGAALGSVARAGIVRLGARRDGDARGYVDPRDLLEGAAPAPAPPVLAPRPAPRPAVPAPPAARAPVVLPVGPVAPPGVPVVAWVALALAAAAAPLGALGLRVRRRAAPRAVAPAAATGAPLAPR